MPEVSTRIKGENIANLSLEQVQNIVRWIYGLTPTGKSKSPSFFSIKNRECLESANLIFIVDESDLTYYEKSLAINLILDKLSRKDVFLRENISLATLNQWILKDINREEINYKNSMITEENIQMFLMKDLNLVFSRYQQGIPSQLTLFNVDCSDFMRFTHDSKHFIVSVDCEMVETKIGHEVGRVSVIDHNYNVIYDKYVKPKSEVLDFLTEYSGLDETILKSGLTFEQMQSDLGRIIGKNTVILGHALENDLSALNIFHERIIGTSHVFLTKDNKRLRLKDLVFQCLNSIIQESKHCSIEDAKNCLDLLRYKIEEFNLLKKSKNIQDLRTTINHLDARMRKDIAQMGFCKIELDDFSRFLTNKHLNVVFVDYKSASRLLELYGDRSCSIFFYFYEENGNIRVII